MCMVEASAGQVARLERAQGHGVAYGRVERRVEDEGDARCEEEGEDQRVVERRVVLIDRLQLQQLEEGAKGGCKQRTTRRGGVESPGASPSRRRV